MSKEIKFEVSRPAPAMPSVVDIRLGEPDSHAQIDKWFGGEQKYLKSIILERREAYRKKANQFIEWVQKRAMKYAEGVPEQYRDRARQWAQGFKVRELRGGKNKEDMEIQIVNQSVYHQNFEYGSRVLNIKPALLMAKAHQKGGPLDWKSA